MADTASKPRAKKPIVLHSLRAPKTKAQVPAVAKETKLGRKIFDGKKEEDVISKCKEVWAYGGSNEEAAYYAEVGIATLYRYLAEHPEVREIRERLAYFPVLKARKTIIGALAEPEHAWRYLEKKRPEEFAGTQQSAAQVNITFNQELAQRSKKYEPTPIDIEPAKMAPPDVGAIPVGLVGLPDVGGRAEVPPPQPPAQN